MQYPVPKAYTIPGPPVWAKCDGKCAIDSAKFTAVPGGNPSPPAADAPTSAGSPRPTPVAQHGLPPIAAGASKPAGQPLFTGAASPVAAIGGAGLLPTPAMLWSALPALAVLASLSALRLSVL